jgi:hypothetical protein
MHGDIIQVGRPPESSLIKLVTGESDLKKKIVKEGRRPPRAAAH